MVSSFLGYPYASISENPCWHAYIANLSLIMLNPMICCTHELNILEMMFLEPLSMLVIIIVALKWIWIMDNGELGPNLIKIDF